MPENSNQTSFGDYRRAAVVTKYHRQGNLQGVVAIIDETNETQRAPHLVMALLGLHKVLIQRLRTDEGIALLADYIQGMAALDATEPPGIDIRRAAQIIDCHGRNDMAGIDHEMRAAATQQRVTETFIQLMDLYEVALPELSSEAGIAWIDAQINAVREQEFRPDQEGGGTSA